MMMDEGGNFARTANTGWATVHPSRRTTWFKGAFGDYIRYPQVKRVLTQLLNAQETQRFKSVAVLSQYAGEGKSFLASALAYGYATLLSKRVLILETVESTRNRSLYLERLIGPPSNEILKIIMDPAKRDGDVGATRRVLKQKDPYTGGGVVDIITTRSAENGSGGESTDFQIGPYIRSLSADYDLVLYDTCALTQSDKDKMDPIIIANNADAAILVTSTRSLSRDTLLAVNRELQQWEIKLLGIVYNSGARA